MSATLALRAALAVLRLCHPNGDALGPQTFAGLDKEDRLLGDRIFVLGHRIVQRALRRDVGFLREAEAGAVWVPLILSGAPNVAAPKPAALVTRRRAVTARSGSHPSTVDSGMRA